MNRRWLLVSALIVTAGVFVFMPQLRSEDGAEEKPQVITLTTGSTKRVAEGRAQVWLGEVESGYNGSGLVPTVEFEVTCGGETYRGWAVEDQLSQPMCGCRVRLVEALDTTPPSARLEVTWTEDYTPNLQAATQGPLKAPPKNRTAKSGTSGSKPRRK